ncbi:hypothetical protein AWN90_40235 [Nocardia terpenica]|uniref:Uncharacterized protein n=2 Tax=Nocardia terpenica TaxID=455432 RepID=A0A161XC73_9NOCA|nr:hypothetical protein AWN90_40235 [Nocardia terpenica]
MLALAIASVIFVPSIGRWLDTTGIAGASPRIIVQHLLAVAGFYQFGKLALTFTSRDPATDPRYRSRLLMWRAGLLLAAVGMIITYRLGPEYRTHAEEFTLSNPLSIAHDWLTLAVWGSAFVLLAVSAAAKLTQPGPDLRASMLGLLGMGTVGAIYVATMAVLLVTQPAYVHHHYHALAVSGGIPAMLVLAFAATPGLIAAWSRHSNPRR